MAKKHTFGFVTCLIIFQITATAENTSAPVNARQVVLKFVESQQKLNSYIIKSNTKATFSYTGFNNNPGTAYRHSDVRFDGDRVKESLTTWGDLSNRNLDLAKENAIYTSWLWDGEKGYELGLIENNRLQTAKYPGLLQIHTEGGTYVDYAKETYKRTMISPAQGYVMGNDLGVGTMFLRADATVKLLDKRSEVNGVHCYVVEAEVPQRGKYKVWIDPVHGFNLARLRSIRETGDLYHGKQLNKDVRWNNFYEVLEFQEINGVWLPKTFKTKADSHDGGYNFDHQEETQTELYEVNLNPDHEKEGSFLTDDVPNGTQVLLEGLPPSVILTWQNGELVPDVDEVAIDQLDKMTDEILAEGKKRKASPEKAVVDTSVMLDAILAEYKKTQTRLGLFYCEGAASENDKKTTEDLYMCDGASFGVQVRAGDQVADCFIWDGQKTMHYTSESVLASVNKRKPQELLATVYPGSPLLGYLNGQPERIDALLSKVAKEATVSKEKLNEKDCYLVKAAIGKDTWRVWFSPEQGYHVVKAEVVADSKPVYLLDQVTFKKVEDVWVPAGCVVKDALRQYTYERTRIDLKPNFTAIKAFESQIVDGTGVTVEGLAGSYFWKSGRVVDKEGNDAF